jgi:hypothetical protein
VEKFTFLQEFCIENFGIKSAFRFDPKSMSVHEISKSNSIEDGASVAEDQIFSDEIKEDGEVL